MAMTASAPRRSAMGTKSEASLRRAATLIPVILPSCRACAGRRARQEKEHYTMATPRTVMWTYTWDLADEGIDPALVAIKNVARMESVSLAVAYHISTFFLPHNPKRQ